jgi:hypothetical protein
MRHHLLPPPPRHTAQPPPIHPHPHPPRSPSPRLRRVQRRRGSRAAGLRVRAAQPSSPAAGPSSRQISRLALARAIGRTSTRATWTRAAQHRGEVAEEERWPRPRRPPEVRLPLGTAQGHLGYQPSRDLGYPGARAEAHAPTRARPRRLPGSYRFYTAAAGEVVASRTSAGRFPGSRAATTGPPQSGADVDRCHSARFNVT